ncbi:MAG: S1 family peptidase [Actinomycetota bacterium]|nr:S1 family peptidase [Actinomycetota bacterium]
MLARRILGLIVACGLVVGASAAPVYGKKANRMPAWGGTDSPIRPGSSLNGSCTFNFVFYTPGTATKAPKAYIGTAGHCTDKLGEEAELPGLGMIGNVVYDSDLVKSAVDFSLIEIKPELVGKTNPEVRVWGGPTRVATVEDFAVGDQVDVHGHGIVFGETEQTRPRYGALFSWTEQEYQADMPAVNGDSGSPLIHHETGAALGIISRYGFTVPPSTDLGPLMTWILEALDDAGFEGVRLATVK